MTPTIGRIVHYKLSEYDATSINDERLKSGKHGNKATAGDVLPAMIVRVWGDTPTSSVQLQVFLDGDHTYWATSRGQGDQPGMWLWPTRDAEPAERA